MVKKYITLENLGTFKENTDAKYQGKMTTSSVNDGTINKNIGFDSEGNIVKETPPSSGMSNPMTTAGDMIYGGSNGSPIRLPKGSANQVLTMNSGATAPEWKTPTTIPTITLNGNSTTTPSFYAPTSVGTNGQVLVSAGSGAPSWTNLTVNPVQDLTSNTAGTLDATAWGNLKSNHYATISSPTMTGLDSSYEFVNIKLSINSTNQYVKLAKNTTNKYSGLFFIEESTNLYEITAYYNGTNIILRCATVK